jgi:hypothetical protein
MSVDGPPLTLLFTANPELEDLQGALAARGLQSVRLTTVEAANTGRPLVVEASDHPLSQAVTALAEWAHGQRTGQGQPR